MTSPDPLANPLDKLLGYQLRRASAVMMADLAAALLPLELRPTDASILLMIKANPTATQSDIGKALGIRSANMAPLMAGLTARGAIERERVDGRSHALTLSAPGHDLAAAAGAAIIAHEARFLPDSPATARDMLITLLRAIRKHDTPTA